MPEAESYDFEVDNHGSLYLFRPLSDTAKDWVADLATSEVQFWANAVVVEPRYIEALIAGAEEDGFTVDRTRL